jgi:hypothetical protein
MDDQSETKASVNEELQFDRAEREEPVTEEPSCDACHTAIAGEYYEVNGKAICATCRQGITAAMTGGSRLKRMFKATALGVLAGAVGAGIYFAVLKLTGYEVGLIAIVVGVLVGTAVRSGSDGRGGWFYQLLAIGITYCAIVFTYVPMIISEIEQIQAKEIQSASTSMPATDSTAASTPAETDNQPFNLNDAAPGLRAFMKVFVYLLAFVVAFISPILDVNLIGYLIKGFALYEAWKINKRPQVTISGPYRLAGGPDGGVSVGNAGQ